MLFVPERKSARRSGMSCGRSWGSWRSVTRASPAASDAPRRPLRRPKPRDTASSNKQHHPTTSSSLLLPHPPRPAPSSSKQGYLTSPLLSCVLGNACHCQLVRCTDQYIHIREASAQTLHIILAGLCLRNRSMPLLPKAILLLCV